MKRNKFVASLMMGVMAMSVLVGCSGGATTSQGGTKTSESGDKKETKKDVVNLTWYTVADQSPKDLKLVNDAINAYTSEKIGVTVDMQFIPFGDYDQKMQAIINSGGKYDICFTANWTNSFPQNARKGAFYNLDELVKAEGKEMYETIDPLFWDKASIDGSIYAVPSYKELDPAMGLLLPKKYVDKYNFDISTVDSLDDLEPYFKQVKENEPGATPWYVTSAVSLTGQYSLLVDGAVPVGIDESNPETTELKVVNIFETESMMNTLKIMNGFYNNGYINADAPTLPLVDTSGLKGKDLGAVWIGAGPAPEKPYSEKLGQEMVYAQVFDPIVKSELGSAHAISSQSKYPEEAMKFLNLVNTDPYLRNLLNYGVEGTHYEKTGDKTIKLLPESQNWNIAYYTMGNLLITDLLEGEPTDKWDQFREFNKNVIVSPAFGFVPNTDSLRNEIASVTNVYKEFETSLSTGSVDPEVYVPKMNAKLKEAGIDKIIEEIQRQLDEWAATK